MSFNFAQAKAKVRRVVHQTLGVRAFYSHSSLSTPIETRARWHSKIDRFADLENLGYAEQVMGVNRIVLIPEVWTTDPDTQVTTNTGVLFEPLASAIVTFPDYQDAAFRLVVLEPVDGPLEQAWQVSLQ